MDSPCPFLWTTLRSAAELEIQVGSQISPTPTTRPWMTRRLSCSLRCSLTPRRPQNSENVTAGVSPGSYAPHLPQSGLRSTPLLTGPLVPARNVVGTGIREGRAKASPFSPLISVGCSPRYLLSPAFSSSKNLLSPAPLPRQIKHLS